MAETNGFEELIVTFLALINIRNSFWAIKTFHMLMPMF
jgi:hypothetical protein